MRRSCGFLLGEIHQAHDQHDDQPQNNGDLTVGRDAADYQLLGVVQGVGITGQTEVVRYGGAHDHAEYGHGGIAIAGSGQNQLPQGAAAQQHGTPACQHHAQQIPQVRTVGDGLHGKARMEIAGDEVVQLYLHDEVSSVTTYVKVLRGFERIHLQPGEEKVVDFVLTPQDMGLWNKDNHFIVEPGTFAVMVGSSSQDIRLQGKFEVK